MPKHALLRFAPSPTGLLHVGNARIALLNYLWCKSHGAKYILRFDNTDTTRSLEKYKAAMDEDLGWLGIKFGRTYQQSDRDYTKHVEALKRAGKIYPCYETPEEIERQRKIQNAQGLPARYQPIDGVDKTRPPHWRFALTEGVEKWNDRILGPQQHNAYEFSDPVVIREDGVVLYTLASVADDVDDGTSTIIRGADHVSNTVVQRQIFRALGADPDDIEWWHIPLVMNRDGKLSKRKLAEGSIRSLRYQGFSPMAVAHSILQVGLRQQLEVHHTLESIAETITLDYAESSAQWSKESCSYWEGLYRRSLDSMDGAALLRSQCRAKITDTKYWSVVKDCVHNTESLVYWNAVFNDSALWFAPQYQFEKLIRKHAAQLSCDVERIAASPELAEYSKSEVGATIRYALTGKVDGPKIAHVVSAMDQSLMLSRLRTE